MELAIEIRLFKRVAKEGLKIDSR